MGMANGGYTIYVCVWHFGIHITVIMNITYVYMDTTALKHPELPRMRNGMFENISEMLCDFRPLWVSRIVNMKQQNMIICTTYIHS